MKTTLNIFYTIVLLCLFSTCGRNINCPDFDKNILSWFPYEKGSVIRLENKIANTSLTIPISDVWINHTTSYNTGNDCGHCDDNIKISSKADFSIFVSIEKNKITYEHYNIKSENFYGNPTISENYTFNNKKYDQAKIFEKTGSNSKLIVAQDFGIVGFIDENGEEWLLIENDATQQIEPMIRNSACE